MAFMDYLPQFGDNVNQTSDDATLQQINLKRQLALADSLRNTPELQGQMVSGHYVAPSWTQSLANVANKYIGNKIAEKAMKDYGSVAEAQQAKQRTGLSKLIKILKNEPISQTTMQPATVDLQQGMNVPTSPFGTNEQVGMTSPYSTQNMAGQGTVMQPVTTQVPAKPLSQSDVLSAIAQYGQDIGNPKISENVILDYAKEMYKPKKHTWINMGDKQVQVDESGNPTGATMPIGISASDVLKNKTTLRGQDLINAREKEKLDPYHIFSNTSPANISNTKQIKLDNGSTVNGTLDQNTGKYFVMQNGKKFWIEE